MHRKPLLSSLDAHTAWDDGEVAMVDRTRRFVSEHVDCFERSLAIGHVTGAAWIVNPNRNKVLLTHHRKLDRWLQLGGHCDGDGDTCGVAAREAAEESGLSSVKLVSSAIFDVDVHRIPARRNEPEHDHYDIRYLFEADDKEDLVISEESIALAWVELERLVEHGVDESVLRLAHKTEG